ncbi:uncharacterized protein at4g00950 [Phtheirospermum japonicum]|uniref:Uncharacterized protein at4g00950 n=1 Tax=Phtheirospermum japonicum TaxID=374723 RepID=A0A830CBC3_9LAMI|nr:uncharacterized protein at4g00950 [Phtheirospermum japonicum]
MGFEVDYHYEPNETPKLTLSKPPYCKPTRHPPPMQTPPLHQSASIPFRWEEAPGKPIATTGVEADMKKAAGKCSDYLPPRLVTLHGDDSKITKMPSPTTVLDGPYVGRSLSLACTFSFRRAGREDGPRLRKRGGGGKFVGRGNLDISHSLGDFFKSEKNVKITRVGKRRSFLSLSGINSNLWVSSLN